MLALLPLDPGARVVAGREPRVDRLAEPRIAPQPACEGELGELDPELGPELPERAEPVQLGQAVEPVARGGSGRSST